MAELGQTTDPKVLVPGDPASIHSTVSSLREYGDLLHLAGAGLKRVDTSDGWSGAAADAFRQVFTGQPGKWLQAGDAFHDAATAMDDYAGTLAWAQDQAKDAINRWSLGAAGQPAARGLLANARSELDSAGTIAATKIGRARDLAPPKPGFWSQVGSFLSGVGDDLTSAGEAAVNGAASLGNAALHDTGSLAETAGGLLLAGVSGFGDGAGAVLDATGVGLPAGLALNGVSTAGVATGLGLAGAGATTIVNDAAGTDRVNVMNSQSGSGTGGGSGRDYTSSVGGIAQKMGYSSKQIKDAIHAVKAQGGWRGLGANKNPDVVVDTTTGNVYVQLPGGGISGDYIGNLYDFLED